MSEKQQEKKAARGRLLKSGPTPRGKTFAQVRDNMSLIVRIGKMRESGASFGQIEKDAGLPSAQGMRAPLTFVPPRGLTTPAAS